MTDIKLEVVVNSAVGLAAAIRGGADRIELVSALRLGGLTPSAGMMRLAGRAVPPTYAMIRPRAGEFVFNPADVAVMRTDIAIARDMGIAGVVLGATAGNALDRRVLEPLVSEADGLGLTLHRAFDLCDDYEAAIDLAVELGFERILTSGGESSAPRGVERLAQAFAYAAGRISIMPGAGIEPRNIAVLMARLPLTEVHASCSEVVSVAPGKAEALGFGGQDKRETSEAKVRALKEALGG